MREGKKKDKSKEKKYVLIKDTHLALVNKTEGRHSNG